MIVRALSLFAIIAVWAAAKTAAPNAARANAKSTPAQAAPAPVRDDLDAVVQLVKGGMPAALVVKTSSVRFRHRTAFVPTREILRQQWTFSPRGSTREVEDYDVNF